jgi:hypothetical protein
MRWFLSERVWPLMAVAAVATLAFGVASGGPLVRVDVLLFCAFAAVLLAGLRAVYRGG